MRDLTFMERDGSATGPSTRFIDSFVEELSRLGYSPLTIRRKCAAAESFVRWAERRRLDPRGFDEVAVGEFVARERRRHPTKGLRRTLNAFIEHLRAAGVTSHPEPSTTAPRSLEERYAVYLRQERALAEVTVGVHLHWVSAFVARHASGVATARGISARDVSDYLVIRSRGLAPKTTHGVATALRSFLRFLFLQGVTDADLSLAVPSVARWRRAAVHPYLRPDEIERVLATCDPATDVGRRDHAILLLLARLGMRACEVAALDLDDLRWRGGEIVVRGKCRTLQGLPLLPDVGEAIALYLRQSRPPSACRRVFLHIAAPHVGLRACSIGGIVAKALDRARLAPPRRGSHVLRHSLATSMIRLGASLAEISEVLGHRSPETTEIYAKVDFEALRSVALPWPGQGGAL